MTGKIQRNWKGFLVIAAVLLLVFMVSNLIHSETALVQSFGPSWLWAVGLFVFGALAVKKLADDRIGEERPY